MRYSPCPDHDVKTPPTEPVRHPLHSQHRPYHPDAVDRRPPGPQDFALTDVADGWLASLPTEDLPAALTARFPRIVNAIVARLQHPAELRVYMEGLLVDRRGDRAGFPPAVMHELIHLHSLFMQAPRYRLAAPTAPAAAAPRRERWIDADALRAGVEHAYRPPLPRNRPRLQRPSLFARLRGALGV